MKRRLLTGILIAALACAFPVYAGEDTDLSGSAEQNTDTLAAWDIRIAVPDGAEAVLDGIDDCYYIYPDETGAIPYVMLKTYHYDSVDEFIPDFTEYMQSIYEDLEVAAEPAEIMIGSKLCTEIDYRYAVSGYAVLDRRILISVNDTTYMFASKEVPELDKMVGSMLEDVVNDCVFLTDDGEEPETDEQEDLLAYAYVYRLDDGMAKYWVDLTSAITDNIVLHCYFRSGDPAYYESNFILDLDTADISDGRIIFHTVTDMNGADLSDWFDSLTFTLDGEQLIMDVVRDESTLAGGADDNILTGTYRMDPMDAGIVYEYYQDDGQLKYWLDLDHSDVVLHAMFRSGDPEYCEETFALDMETAEDNGEDTFYIKKIYNSRGDDISDWFSSFSLTAAGNAVTMTVERDESTLAGGADDNILTGSYVLEPRTYLKDISGE